MKLRIDQAHYAGWHRALDLGALERKSDEDYVDTLSTPAAELGDVWIIRQSPTDNKTRAYAGHLDWPIVGYALTCPNTACEAGLHFWDHAYTCTPSARTCNDKGCWQWTGTIAAGTLTANPSLHVLAERGGCGWHGWLRNGAMVDA